MRRDSLRLARAVTWRGQVSGQWVDAFTVTFDGDRGTLHARPQAKGECGAVAHEEDVTLLGRPSKVGRCIERGSMQDATRQYEVA